MRKLQDIEQRAIACIRSVVQKCYHEMGEQKVNTYAKFEYLLSQYRSGRHRIVCSIDNSIEIEHNVPEGNLSSRSYSLSSFKS